MTWARAVYGRTVCDENRRWAYLWLIGALFAYGSVNDVGFGRPMDVVAMETAALGVLLAVVWCAQPNLRRMASLDETPRSYARITGIVAALVYLLGEVSLLVSLLWMLVKRGSPAEGERKELSRKKP